jgi:hypothetical protein
MKIHVVVGQRKCDYPGEYGIEALACMSGYEFSESPEYLMEELAKARQSNEFDSVEIVELGVSEKELRDILFPANKIVSAAVLGVTHADGNQQGS